MPTPEQTAEYQATYRRRAAFRAQAILLGWTRLPILDAYVTDTGELVVVDKAGSRYGTDAVALVTPEPVKGIVEPLQATPEDLAARWQKGHEKVGIQLGKLDLSTAKHADALKIFTDLAALSLRMVEILQANDGPDWRETLKIEG